MKGKGVYMVMHRCSLVLCLRDRMTGRALPPNSVRALLDGAPARVRFKSGGYMVFTGLEPGGYVIELRGGRYEAAVFTANAPESGYAMRIVGLAPKNRSAGGTRVTVDGAEYFIPDGGITLHLSQERCEAGDTSALIRARGAADMPITLMFGEGGDAELCTAEYMNAGEVVFSTPLTRAHSRGETLRLCWDIERKPEDT
jgi:hypothetical protein